MLQRWLTDRPSGSIRRRWVRILVTGVAAFIGLQIVFFGLLVASVTVPDSPIVNHLSQDVKSHTYGPTGIKDRMGGSADSFTECVVAGTGIGLPEANPVRKAALMPRLSNCELGAKQVQQLASGQQLDNGGYYFRYWAGYTSLTRPALALFGLTGLRILVGGLFVASLFAAATVLRRELGGPATIGLLAPLFLASNLMSTPTSSFSQALSMSVVLLSLWIIGRLARRSLPWGLAGVALTAALFCYVDLLTTPAIPWAFSTATLAAFAYLKQRSLLESLRFMLAAGLLWPISYAATWATRWLLAVPFAGAGRVWDEVAHQILFRTQGEWKNTSSAFGAATLRNLRYWNDHITTAHAVLAISAVLIVVGLILALRGGARNLLAIFVISLPAMIVPVWYEALSNHSQIHAFFVYKAVPAALGVVLFAVAVGARCRKGDHQDSASQSESMDAENDRKTALTAS